MSVGTVCTSSTAPVQSLVVKLCATTSPPSTQLTTLLEYPSPGLWHSPNAAVMVSLGAPVQSALVYTF